MTARHDQWHAPARFPDDEPGAKLEFHWTFTLSGALSLGGTGYHMSDPLTVKALLARQAGGVSLVLTLDGLVFTDCRRCLEQIGVAIQDDFLYSFVLRSDRLEEDASEAFGPDDEAVLVPVARLTGPIDLGDLVWECFVCSLPPYAACEGGCVGDVPAQDATVDPRLQVFADLLKNGEGGNE